MFYFAVIIPLLGKGTTVGEKPNQRIPQHASSSDAYSITGHERGQRKSETQPSIRSQAH
jgi:hypothetical protein